MFQNLELSILSVIAYYNALDMPITSLEIYQYKINLDKQIKRRDSDQNASFFDVVEILSSSEFLKKYVSQKNGFYFLKNHSDLYDRRIEAQKISDKKWKKFLKICYFLQIIPFLKLALANGSIAFGNTKIESDFDLLIVAKNGRIWTARAAAIFISFFLGVKRTKKRLTDKLCLNYYLTDKSMEIIHKSIYTAQNYYKIFPVVEVQNGLYEEFLRNNIWFLKFINLSELNFGKFSGRRVAKKNIFLASIRKIFEFILSGFLGDKLEFLFSKIQLVRIKKDSRTYKKGGRVTFNDNELEFHPDSPEIKIISKYNKFMSDIGYSGLMEKDSGLL